MEQDSTAVKIFLFLVIGILAMGQVGCRAIRQQVGSRSEIASRKFSRLGLEAMHQNRWSTAEEHFAAALELDDNDDRAQMGMAEALWHRGERESAIQHMEQAVLLSASEPQLLNRLGRMYFEVGRIEDAEQKVDEALLAGRDLAEAWALHGDCLASRNRDEEALAAYHRALVLRPNYAEVQLSIAEVYRRSERFDRLLATLDRLQEDIEPTNCPIQVQHLRGIAMKELGRPREAANCFLAVARCNPNDPNNLLLLAEAELEAGDVAAARVALEKALQIDPTCQGAEVLVARLQETPSTLPR